MQAGRLRVVHPWRGVPFESWIYRWCVRAFALLVISLLASDAVGQSITDPLNLEFTPSPDHSATLNGAPVISRYNLEFSFAGASAPFQVEDLGKPNVGSNGRIKIALASVLTSWPAAGIAYEARVTAVGPAGRSVSTPSNAFSFSGPCTYAVSTPPTSVPASGGSGSVSVVAGPGCAWNASSSVGWISIGSGGTGNGSVSYGAAGNTTGANRSGGITVAGRSFTLSQAASSVPCTFTVSSVAPLSFTAAGGTGSASVTTTSACTWGATSSVPWITFGPTLNGSGARAFAVAANTTTTARTATVTIAGRTYTVTQAGNAACSPSVSPSSLVINSTGGTSTVTVTASAGCGWSASSQAAWVTIGSGTRMGTVNVPLTISAATAKRVGSVTIAGRTITVAQHGSSSPQAAISSPVHLATIARTFTITGWVIDLGAASGTGVDLVTVQVVPNPGTNLPLLDYGQAQYGLVRDDVAASYGTQYRNSGFSLTLNGLPGQTCLILVRARSALTQQFTNRVVQVSLTP